MQNKIQIPRRFKVKLNFSFWSNWTRPDPARPAGRVKSLATLDADRLKRLFIWNMPAGIELRRLHLDLISMRPQTVQAALFYRFTRPVVRPVPKSAWPQDEPRWP